MQKTLIFAILSPTKEAQLPKRTLTKRQKMVNTSLVSDEIANKKSWVLKFTLILNIAVSVLKIITGLFTGLLNLVADGIHSGLDSVSNYIGIHVIRISKKPADENYPYGYSRFETAGVMAICIFLGIAFVEIVHLAIERIINPATISFGPLTFIVVAISIAINIFVAIYEKNKAKELESDFLEGDAEHTLSDVGISVSVLIGLILIKFGWMIFDPVITGIIALFIFRSFWKNFTGAIATLCDAAVVPEDEIKTFVTSISGVKFCHAIRSRGRKDAFFMDIHIGVHSKMSIEAAHDNISHRVKLALRERYPKLICANIQIEPDNESSRNRVKSVFKEKDY